MRIVTVLGARPQFVKAAALSRVLAKTDRVTEVIVHTGQHYDQNMSDIFFDEMEIPRPAVSLAVGSGSHGVQTGRMLADLETILLQEKPDFLLVYGDTNSTLAGALAAAKIHIPIAHVEAGLRSFNRRMPEEINRLLTDHCSSILFAPTDNAVANLVQEGVSKSKIAQVGDIMFDVAIYFAAKAEQRSTILADLSLRHKEFILATVHRAENTDDPTTLKTIFEAFSRLSANDKVVFPMHPRTRAAITRLGITPSPNLVISDPVGYLDMIMLERAAALVVTDSGGVQKEAYFQGVPCVTLRTETEWVELVQAGWNKLVPPTSPDDICRGVREMAAKTMPDAKPLYGDGTTAEQISRRLMQSIQHL